MRHRRIQPEPVEQRRPDACGPGAARRHRRTRRRRGRVRTPLAPDGRLVVHKQRSGASGMLERIVVPPDTRHVLLHVRDYTKGHPRIAANNHPIRHGSVVGVHNGRILNDDELMAYHGFERAEPGHDRRFGGHLRRRRGDRVERGRIRGDSAARWRPPGSTSARRSSSTSPAAPAVRSGSARRAASSSSPPPCDALEIAEHYTGLRLRKRELAEGTLLALDGPRAVRRELFVPDATYEADPLPRRPLAARERAFCLQRLATTLRRRR